MLPRISHTHMTMKVTELGLIIPKEFLEGMNTVEIRKEHGVIVIVPITEEDPIHQLGQEPVVSEMNDASVHHDCYLDGP